MKRRNRDTELLRRVRVAVCGELPTACEHLARVGIIHIDHYSDAVNLREEARYDLILVYAPQGEGLLDTYYCAADGRIPVRLLREPSCHSALLELQMTVLSIAHALADTDGEAEQA